MCLSICPLLDVLQESITSWYVWFQEELVAAVMDCGFEAEIVTASRCGLVMLQVHLPVFHQSL